MQARVRRSATAPSGLAYHVLTPGGVEKHLENQRKKPDHLKDLYFYDQSQRSISDYSPGVGVGPSAPSQTSQVFVSDNADLEDQKRCTAYNGYDNIDELITSDRPIAALQVTRFSDATIITVICSHIIGDSFAIKSIFKSWEAALYGRPIEPFVNLGDDPFLAYGPGGDYAGKDVLSNSPPLPPGWKVYGALDKARFLARNLWDLHVTRPEKDISQKYVFISNAEAKALREQANRDLLAIEKQRRKDGIESKEPLRVSLSNVLYAWIMRNNHASLGHDEWTTPITIVNARAKPPTGIKAGSDDFPSNNWYGAGTVAALGGLKVGELLSMSLGELALHVREGVEAATTPENVRRTLAFHLNHNLWKKPTGQVAFWAPPHHHWSGLSDWRLMNLSDIDLSPARVGDSQAKTTVCGFNSHMAYAHSQRNRWVCLGEASGGVWFLGIVSNSEWENPRGFGKYRHFNRRTSRL